MQCNVCGEDKPEEKFNLVHKKYRRKTCRACLYERDFKSSKIPRVKTVRKFSGIECKITRTGRVSYRKDSE